MEKMVSLVLSRGSGDIVLMCVIGVERAVEIMKREVAIDAANIGVGDLKQINESYVSDALCSQRKGNLLNMLTG